MCPAPAPAGPPKRVAVTHGVASQMGARKKDEDRTRVGACRVGERTFLYFGLYDGHGGKGAADLCAAELHDVAAKRAAEEAKRAPEKRAAECLESGLVAACWELDDRLGSLAVDSGTTATCLFVDADSSDGSCLLAWVGDSCAYRFDMLAGSPGRAPRGRLSTTQHNPSNAAEVSRMRAEWGARRELLTWESPTGAAAGDGDDDARLAEFCGIFEARLRKKALASGEKPMRPGLVADALRRERRIDDRLERENVVRKASFANLASAAREKPSHDVAEAINLKRCDSTFTRRYGKSGQEGPLVVQGNWTRGDGASTVVTRSIGDWDASRAVIPEPEIATWPLPAADDSAGDAVFDRVILASDGLWDLVSPAAAEKMVRRVADPQQAAEKLLRAATRDSKNAGYGGCRFFSIFFGRRVFVRRRPQGRHDRHRRRRQPEPRRPAAAALVRVRALVARTDPSSHRLSDPGRGPSVVASSVRPRPEPIFVLTCP